MMTDMTEQQPTPVEPSGAQGGTPSGLTPHRGVLILVLGIVGIACCFICGIIAWVMGNDDLRKMDEGQMNPEGRGLTQAGKICGIISVALAIIGLIIWFIIFAIGAGASVIHGI